MSSTTPPAAPRRSVHGARPRRPLGRLAAAARRLRTGALATVLLLTLTACGVRMETPAPQEPSPDATEQLRARTVADAVSLQEAAALALDGPEVPAESVAAVLADVASFSRLHADQLGGVYDSGLTPAADDEGTSAPVTLPPLVVTAQDVLDELAAAAATATTDADAATDAALARLVGSVATSRAQLESRLTAALTGATPGPTAPDATAPSSPGSAPPAGLGRADIDALILAHDQAGYGLEVIAARSTGDQRDRIVAAARAHRAAADAWAHAAGTSGTAQDPRRAAYALPDGIGDAAVLTGLGRSLEVALAEAYATATSHAAAGERAGLLAGLHEATVSAAQWGAAPVPFPGMPEAPVS